MSVADNLKKLKSKIPDHVRLVAVTKTHPEETIMEAYDGGHKIFGENKAQELVRKYNNLPKDIEWHMIGHLQTNKVKLIAPFVHMIHSVDSLKLLETINKEAEKNQRVIHCLLQIKIASEETKFGLGFTSAEEILRSEEVKHMKYINIAGLMGMATFTDDTDIIEHEFKYLAECFVRLKQSFFSNADAFREISMGMSDDYPIAIRYGTTIVRIGSIIFGERNYN